jgi:DNA gyrase subunit B
MIGAVLMTSDYDDGNIRVLEGLEAVRVRPGMYIGNTGQKGLHRLVYGIVANSIDEALAGRCKNIDISINANGSITILDDGNWISTKIYLQTNKSTIELLFTVFHIGFRRVGVYQTPDWFYESKMSVVSALSSHLEVKVWRDLKIHIQHFERGLAVSELEIVSSDSDLMGTMITFLPDPEIFKESIEFNFDMLASRFRQLAYLNAGIRISLTDYRHETKVEQYYYEGGVRNYVAYLNIDRPNPEFEGATRTRLANKGVRRIIDSIVSDALSKYFTANPNIAHAILDKAIKAFDVAEIGKKERKLLRHQNRAKDLPRSISHR